MLSDLNAFEQYILELINRARADPAAEAARLGIGLNEGLSAGTISNIAKQPLAANDLLNAAAAGHSRWMLNEDVFTHTGAGGSSPGDRIEAAGYEDWRIWGENIAYIGGGNVRTAEVAAALHDNLFLSAGHRRNILNGDYSEIGLGEVFGDFRGFDAAMLTQSFASETGDPFLLGVVYRDLDGDDFFDPGEELSGVRVSVSGEGQVVTGPGGGYELRIEGSESLTVTFSGGELGRTVTLTTRIGEENAKLDLRLAANGGVDGQDDTSGGGSDGGSGGATSTRGADRMVGGASDDVMSGGGGRDTMLGGGGDDRLKGDAGADRLMGGAGADTLEGGAGGDRLFGQAGGDMLKGGAGADRLSGGGGRDKLIGGGGDDRLVGGGAGDRAVGGRGDDTLIGGAGADTLIGGGGADRIIGGGGPDRLTGGGGPDVFVFAARDGADLVTDFRANDLIEIRSGAARFADLDISGGDAGAVIAFGRAEVTLAGVAADALSAGDFVFV